MYIPIKYTIFYKFYLKKKYNLYTPYTDICVKAIHFVN